MRHNPQQPAAIDSNAHLPSLSKSSDIESSDLSSAIFKSLGMHSCSRISRVWQSTKLKGRPPVTWQAQLASVPAKTVRNVPPCVWMRKLLLQRLNNGARLVNYALCNITMSQFYSCSISDRLCRYVWWQGDRIPIKPKPKQHQYNYMIDHPCLQYLSRYANHW